MKAKTEELLYFLLWSADRLFRPTFRNLTDSFEAWAYREGFQRQLWELERKKLLEQNPQLSHLPARQREYRLTEQGRLSALGGRDPVTAWNRSWDGLWRLVVFDVPDTQSAARIRLWRFLRERHFGFLQKSVWITPDPVTESLTAWDQGRNVDTLVILEAHPCRHVSAETMVMGAWDFDRINRCYTKCLHILQQPPETSAPAPKSAGLWRRWAQMERTAWWTAVSLDPLLPNGLLPKAYLGKQVWVRRQEAFAQAMQQKDGHSNSLSRP
jgi:DNA-binding transcriptional regulator PaaX